MLRRLGGAGSAFWGLLTLFFFAGGGRWAKVGMVGDREGGKQVVWGRCASVDVSARAASLTFPIPAWACPSLTTTGK